METNNELYEKPRSESGFDSASTTPMDLGSGLSNGSDSAFGKVFEEDSDFNSYGPSDRETLSFTQMGSAFLTPAATGDYTPVSQNPPTGFSSAGVVPTGAPFFYCHERNVVRPTECKRGTNFIVPLGGHTFIQLLGSSDTTALGSLASVTASMNALSPSFRTAGSYREIANWKRIFELKNVVISYFNRSIPFTDLEASDRFAIEMCYMRDVMTAAMPIFAKNAALEWVKHQATSGYQYPVELLTNLNSLTAERLCKQIFAAICELPSIDDVAMKRCGEFSKLHLTSKATGFTPTLISQDWSPAGPGRYRISNAAQSGYTFSTTLAGVVNSFALNGTTFHEWMEMWLRNDIISEDVLSNTLAQFANLAQSIRTNYSILLGCAMQLEQKGAVSYNNVGSFLPVAGVTDYYLSYKVGSPTFSYTFKERFEYAPRNVVYESVGGTANLSADFNLLSNPQPDAYNGIMTFTRPVGLYKGEKAWGTKEVIGIGMFKRSSLSANSNTYTLKQLFAAASVASPSVTSTAIGTENAVLFEDAYYGDIYSTALSHAEAVTSGNQSSFTYYTNAHELVSWYGVYLSSPTAAPFATLSTWAWGITPTNPYTLVAGSSIMDYTTVDVSEANSKAVILIPQIQQILTQLDLTFYASSTYNAASRTCTPIILWNGYRGCEFDKFDITPMENAASDSYRVLSIEVRRRKA